jgi:hypothetical protein
MRSRPRRSGRSTSRSATQKQPGRSANVNDILSGAGLAEGKAVQRVLAAWDDIFDISRPDLVVADCAPLATLAARGRIPLVVVGNASPYRQPRCRDFLCCIG